MGNVVNHANILPENADLIQETNEAQSAGAEGKTVCLSPSLPPSQTFRECGTDPMPFPTDFQREWGRPTLFPKKNRRD